MSRLIESERVAVWVFAILLTAGFAYYPLYNAFWIMGMLPIFLIWFVALIVAAFHVAFAFWDPHPSLLHRLRSAIAIPVAILAVLAIQVLFAPGPRTTASIHLVTHTEEMEQAQREAGPGRPAAIPYVEGIPDGGLAVIRSRTIPTELPPMEHLRLTNEGINRCRVIVGDAWVCWYD